MPRHRSGLTLTELLVVLFIIGVLLALLLPAVQSARETARKATCQNHLRQMGLALQSYVASHGTLPGLYNGSFVPQPRSVFHEFHYHSWQTSLLSRLEQGNVLDMLDLSRPASDKKNQPAVNLEIPVFLCPSTSNTHRVVPEIAAFSIQGPSSGPPFGTAARSDYEAIGGVQMGPQKPGLSHIDLSVLKLGAWGAPTYEASTGKPLRYSRGRLADITDGLSNTMLVGEKAGRPDLFRRGEPEKPYTSYSDPDLGMDHHQAAWAISTHFWWLTFGHERRVNDANDFGIYGFHRGGANVLLADGSVRFLSESTDPDVLVGLASRDGGEAVTLD